MPVMKSSELVNALESLDIKKSTGLDGLSPQMLKRAARVISSTLLKMINISIYTGNFPDNLQIARLIPIHKGGSKDDPSNVRPISILSVLSKLLEKHVTNIYLHINTTYCTSPSLDFVNITPVTLIDKSC